MKESKISISARIPEWVRKHLEDSAFKNERTLSQELSLRLKKQITEERKIAGI